MLVEIKDDIRRGAALLDREEPGWRDRVAPGELVMQECAHCVVGQVIGVEPNNSDLYYDTLRRWFGESDDFETHMAHGFYARWERWDGLRDEWIGYIKGEWS